MKVDTISITLIIFALCASIYLSLWVADKTYVLFPSILLFAGLFINFMVGGRIQQDPYVDRNELQDIGLYSAFILAVIYVTNMVQAYNVFIPQNILSALAQYGSMSIAVGMLLAVSEEVFFRAGLLEFFRLFTRSDIVAIFASAGAFMIYHFAVYQKPNALIYVFAAGAAMAYAVIRTDRLSPSLIGHVVNNAVALGLFNLMWSG